MSVSVQQTQDVPGTATKLQTKQGISPKHISKASAKHPLDPLTTDELAAASAAVRKHIAVNTPVKAFKFITSNLIPPPKRDVLGVLGIPLAHGEKVEKSGAVLKRRAEFDFIDIVAGDAYNITATLNGEEWNIDDMVKLPEGTQPQISVEELFLCEQAVRADERVQKLCAEVGIKTQQISADGWSIGYDARFPASKRIQQGLLFARLGEHENLYAHPLDFIPVLDSNSMKVVHIDFPPHRTKGGLSVPTTIPPELSEDSFAASNRARIPPPLERYDFLSDLRTEHESGYKPRADLKPLHVVQPEGVSFKVDGHELEWQKWKMHVAFSHREGLAISTITYNDDGEVRPIFYRLSLAEMVVPYGAPEFPHPRKFAFDVGEYGMGTMANELTLGCDCLGQIHYLPGHYIGHDGSAVLIKNAICIHEEDAGLGWKHSDYRPGGRGQSARARRLVVSMICTLANYEYVWNYYFYQDGTIELEIRLTGILQTYTYAENEESNPHGTLVAPRVNAHYHQHLFSIRVDPMLDGLKNSVIQSNIVPLSAPTGSSENFAGNGFTQESKVLRTAREGACEYNWEAERRWRIVNTSRTHYSSKQPVSYALGLKGVATRMLAKPDSWVATRAKFATKSVWVVRDVEDDRGPRMWPAGKFVPQTRKEPEDSVGKWADCDDKIDDEDILLFITVGTTHIPRPEDWPVMPCENLSLTFKPVSFFKTNPALDVPGAADQQSKAAFSDPNAHVNGAAGVNGCH